MRVYRVTAPITLHTGVIGLDSRQADPRARCLVLWPDGVYTITAPVQFKAGEVISLEPEAVKGLAHLLVKLAPEVAANVEPHEAAVVPVKKKPARKPTKARGGK